jgi:hypothetical protein
MRRGSALDERDGLRRRAARAHQAFCDGLAILYAHQDQQGVDIYIRRPIQREEILPMPSDHGEGFGHSAARRRDARQRRRRQGRGDSRNDFHFDAVAHQMLPLFRAAREYHGVAALQTHHGAAFGGITHHEAVDSVLDYVLLALPLAAVHQHGTTNKREDFGAYQAVMNHHLGALQNTQGFESQ